MTQPDRPTHITVPVADLLALMGPPSDAQADAYARLAELVNPLTQPDPDTLEGKRTLLLQVAARYNAVHASLTGWAEWSRQVQRDIAQMERPQGWQTFEEIMAADWYKIEASGAYEQVVKTVEAWCRDHPGVSRYGITARDDGETMQAYFNVVMDRNRPLEEQLGALALLPMLSPYEGVRTLGILEHNLSRNGSYSLQIADDGTARVMHGVLLLCAFPDLRRALEYVYDHLPYKWREEDLPY